MSLQRANIHPLKKDPASGRLNQPLHGSGRRRFSASTLSDEPKGLSFFQSEGDIIHRFDISLFENTETIGKIFL